MAINAIVASQVRMLKTFRHTLFFAANHPAFDEGSDEGRREIHRALCEVIEARVLLSTALTVIGTFPFATDGGGGENAGGGNLLLVGSTLYGTTEFGGTTGHGSIFSLPITGGTPTTIATFDDIPAEGPSSLIYGNGVLYGTMVSDSSGIPAGIVFSVPSPVERRPALAVGTASPLSGFAPLATTAVITNLQNLWLSPVVADSGAAMASPASNTFAADGLIAPAGKASYAATFSAGTDRVAVTLSMSAAAGIMNLLDLALPASAWKPSDKLIDELDKIYKTISLFNAKADLTAAAAGRISASSAAETIANYFTELFANNDAQWKLVKADLKDAGVTVTAAEMEKLESATKVEKSAKSLIGTALLDTQLVTGAPIFVDFTAATG